MIDLLQMWALVEVLGLVCLPLTMTVCHNLPDRGWAFSKALGVVLLTFCVWLPLMCEHSLPFSPLFIAAIALLVLIGNLLGLLWTRQTIVKVVRSNTIYILACELVFLGMVFLLGWLRTFHPSIEGQEAFMDEGFIAAIMRSPHFPPADMWLAGYSINYYYYAHFAVAILAKLLGQSPSIAFNTGISMYFGLTAVNLFGVTRNVVAWAHHLRTKRRLESEMPAEQVNQARVASCWFSPLWFAEHGHWAHPRESGCDAAMVAESWRACNMVCSPLRSLLAAKYSFSKTPLSTAIHG